MYCRFHILMMILAVIVQTTAGVRCYACIPPNPDAFTSKHNMCISPESFYNAADILVNCEGSCSVELGEFGDMGEYKQKNDKVIFKRGCVSDRCKNRDINCCICNSDGCNINNLCGTAYILSPSILIVIGGFLLSLLCA